jgi:hypothetical protein
LPLLDKLFIEILDQNVSHDVPLVEEEAEALK